MSGTIEVPYEDERAGLAAIRALAEEGIVEGFRGDLAERHPGEVADLPEFEPFPAGNARSRILAIDGSNIYEPIPGALPATEAGLVSLGVVVIDTLKLETLERAPASGAVDPRQLRETEHGKTLATMVPGRNASKRDGTSPQAWFREIVNGEIDRTNLGGETFAETLSALLGDRVARCANGDCSERVTLPAPGKVGACAACGDAVYLTDGLRIHEQFVEHRPAGECHARFRDALELLALMNAVRYLASSERGRSFLGRTAFILDGPLAAFGTIAVLAGAIRKELGRIQELLGAVGEPGGLLVMSGVKSGAFVDHAAEIDRAPQPDKRIPRERFWLPDNEYIRGNIVAGASDQSKPWGELTYFGRPVVVKTGRGQRLVLNVAQPEADPPLTEASQPRVLGDAIATASPLGVGAHQFLPLRRVHARAAIPLQSGTDLIGRLAR